MFHKSSPDPSVNPDRQFHHHSASSDQPCLQAALIQAIQDDITAHFATPTLAAGAVAERLGISVADIHFLLHETGRSFSEHLLEHRLRQAWALLFNPNRYAGRVAQVAYACGFSDLAYFNRTFRRRYRMTPAALSAVTLNNRK